MILISNFFLKLTPAARDTGLIRALGPELWQTLCVLALYMDRDGVCYPTIARLQDDLGLSRQGVINRINQLCEFRWCGKPVIERKKVVFNGHTKNIYKIDWNLVCRPDVVYADETIHNRIEAIKARVKAVQ